MEKRQRVVKILPRFVASVNLFQDYIFKSSPKNAIEFGDDLFLELEIIAKLAGIYKEFPYLKTRSKYYRYKIFKKTLLHRIQSYRYRTYFHRSC